MLKISAVIPCHNEAESVAKVIDAIPREVYEVIVVDNNSTDDTARIAREKGARVVSETRRGYGNALRAGFAAATGDVIVMLDGDGQYPARDVVRAARYLEDTSLDFVICSRFPLDDRDSLNVTRRWGNAFFTIYTNLLFGTRFTDSWSGMIAFRRSLLPALALESGEMTLSQEIKIKAAINPLVRLGEIHIGYAPRVGTSKLFPIRHGLMMLWYGVDLRRRVGRVQKKR